MFRDVAFTFGSDGVIHAEIESSWEDDLVTQDTALRDLSQAESVMGELAPASPVFGRCAVGQQIAYEVCEDYGMGRVVICSRRNGEFTWGPGFPRSAG